MRNKKLIVPMITLTAWVLPVACFSQSGSFDVKIQLTGLANSKKIYLLELNDKWNPRYREPFHPLFFDTITTTVAKDGKVGLAAKIDSDGKVYIVSIEGTGRNCLLLPAKGEQLTIRGDMKKWPDVDISGGRGMDEMLRYQKGFMPLVKNKSEADVYRRNFLNKNPNSLYAAYVILNNKDMTVEERILAYEKLTPYVKNSFFGLKIAKAIKENTLVPKKIKEIGSQLPDFNISDPGGSRVSILDLVSESALTLIRFYSSDLIELEKQYGMNSFEPLKNAYTKYGKDKFNIVTIYVGKNTDKWKEILLNQQWPWHQGLDNIQNAFDKIFGIYMVPADILVDNYGKILKLSYNTEYKGTTSKEQGGLTLPGNINGIIDGFFTVTLQLDSLTDGTRVYMAGFNDKKETTGPSDFSLADTIFNAVDKEGKVRFSGITPANGKYYQVGIVDENFSLPLFLSGGEHVKITGSLQSFSDIKIEGSSASVDCHDYQKELFPLMMAKKSNEVTEFRNNFLLTHTNSSYSPFIILMNKTMNAVERKAAYEKISEEARKSYFGIRLSEAVKNNKLFEPIVKGSLLPDFKVSTREGKVISLKEMAAKSKYTLIDFWASWCVPCIKEIPNLKKVYDRFNNNGFNIISISIDREKKEWLSALDKEKMPWVQVLDIGRHAANFFGMGSVPTYILVNEKSEMLAFLCGQCSVQSFGPKIGGKDIMQLITELFKAESE